MDTKRSAARARDAVETADPKEPQVLVNTRLGALVSQTIASWNRIGSWMRELDRLRRTPEEEGGFGAAAGF